MDGQGSLFEFMMPTVKIGSKKICLIELFAGYGSQAMASRNLGVKFMRKVVEFDKYAMAS